MRKFWLAVTLLAVWCGSAHSAILVLSPGGGSPTVKATLSAAATDADVAGKTVVITSALSAVQSNISSATLHAWPADRVLRRDKGGTIGNTTLFRFATGASVDFPGDTQVFSGAGAVTGLKEAIPQWWGKDVNGNVPSSSVQSALNALTSGGIMKAPADNYLFSSVVDIPYDNTIIEGAGGKLTKFYVAAPSASIPVMIRAQSSTATKRKNIHIRGVYFYGNATVRIWEYTGGVNLANIQDSSVKDCFFEKLSALAVFFGRYGSDNSKNADNIDIIGNTIRDCYSDGFYGQSVTNSRVVDNHAYNVGTEANNMDYLFEGITSSTISANTSYNGNGTGMIVNNGATDRVANVAVVGNTIRGAAVYGAFLVGSYGLSFTGNTLSDNGTTYEHHGVMMHTATESTSIPPVGARTRNLIAMNNIARSAGAGIAVSTSGNSIIGNMLEDNNTTNTAGGAGIHLFNNSGGTTYPHYNKIEGNYILNTLLNEEGLVNGHQKYGVIIPANAKGNEVTNTTVLWMDSGSSTASNLILDQGSETTRSGNRAAGIVGNSAPDILSGRAVLVGGTVTINTSQVEANDNIALTRVVTGGTVGHLTLGTVTVGTSFVINSSSASDTSTIFWEIRH